ncbi:MAG: hypothetical protein MUF87_01245 [Anaerolineae bacterium]|jgi:hypothetical protein|nr:hypothetical protein [Anaerolineae bacterium]
MQTNIEQEQLTYCAVHPDRETGLRCNKCERYMCAQCAVLTPVGYRCRECVRTVDNKFFTGTNQDYLIVAAVAAISSGLGAAAMLFIPIWLFVIFIALPIGGGVAYLIRRAVQGRRGRYTGYVGAAAVVIATVIVMLISRTDLINIGLWVYAGIVAGIVYNRFDGKL